MNTTQSPSSTVTVDSAWASRTGRTFARVQRIADATTDWLEHRLGSHRSLVAASIVAVCSYLLCLLFYSPPFWIGLTADGRTQDFVRQAADPLTRDLAEPILAYRPVHPWVLHLLGLRSAEWIHVFPFVYTVLFLGLLFVFLRRETSASTAALACGALSTTMVVQTGTYWLGLPDALCSSVGVALLLLPPWWSIPLVPIAMLTDERFILTAGFIPLVKLRLAGSRFELKRLIVLGVPIVLGLAVTFAIRHALQVGWLGPGIGTQPIYKRLIGDLLRIVPKDVAAKPYLVPLTVFFAFRFAWLLPLAAVRMCSRPDDRRLQWLTGALLVLGAYAVFVGGDWTRGMAFMFPMWLLALIQLDARHRNVAASVLLVIIGLNVFTPQLNIDYNPGRLGLVRPLPIAIIRYTTGWDLGQLLR